MLVDCTFCCDRSAGCVWSWSRRHMRSSRNFLFGHFKINTNRMRLLNRELNARRKLLEACRVANTLPVNTSKRLGFLSGFGASLMMLSVFVFGLPFPRGRCGVLPQILNTPIRSVRQGKCTHDNVLSYIYSISSLLQNRRARILGLEYHTGNIRSAWRQLQDNCLTVSQENKISGAVEEDGHTICERHYGKFSRTLRLPNGTKVS